jgi:hypothetical protein
MEVSDELILYSLLIATFSEAIPDLIFWVLYLKSTVCHGRDHMAVGFITTHAISAYHH